MRQSYRVSFSGDQILMWGSPSGWVVKNLPAVARDMCLILVSGRSPVEEMATQSSILAWEIPWIEDLGVLQFMESPKSQIWLSDLTTTEL